MDRAANRLGVSRDEGRLDAVGLFASSPIPLEVVSGLGMTGQLLVRTPGATAEAVSRLLGHNPSVAYFEPNTIVTTAQVPNDPYYGFLWAMDNTGVFGGTPDADIDAPEAWDLTRGSPDTVVGVIDSGVDYTHPDLAANIWTNPGEIAGNRIDDDGDGFVDDVHGYDFINNDGDPMDDFEHGTHVAGTIAATGNNGQGVTGVNWTSSVMAIKCFDATGRGAIATAVQAVNYATLMHNRGVNVRVTNNSWGSATYDPALYNAIRSSGDAGMLFIAAAGNGGQDGIGDNNDLYPNYPASYNLPNIIAVAATDQSDRLATFSNYGPTSVDLAAPGVDIWSTVPGGFYDILSGTSMAAPHVAGVAALAWSLNRSATATQVRDAILGGVDRLSSLNGKVATEGASMPAAPWTCSGHRSRSAISR